MGTDHVTVRNLEVVEVDTEDNVLLVKGAVPGPNRYPSGPRQVVGPRDRAPSG